MNFSIIVPLYNKERHIKRAINSLLQQSYSGFEIIVVDDGSTDNSYCEVASIKDKRVKLLKKTNGGVSSARNYGIQHSSHEYIGFLDADDLWKPSFLESISKLIKKYPDAGAYATAYEYGKYNKFKRASINVKLSEGQSEVIDYFKCSLNDPLISASSVVIRKSVFENIGLFSEELTRGEDLEMWYRIALKYDVAFINEVLSVYFQDSDNKLTHIQRDYTKSFMSHIEKIINENRGLGNSPYFEEYMISRLMSKVRFLISEGENKNARKLLWKYKYTKCNKKNWYLNYIISFKPSYNIYCLLRKIK